MFRSRFSRLDRIFHWLVLEPQASREAAFDFDRSQSLSRTAATPGPGPADEAVYVCGLARSGTTMLLRVLDDVDVFRSLSYRDMPFVLAPNLWRRIVGDAPAPAASAERAHGDGILVDVDSPESFEQVFWRTFTRRLPDAACFGSEPPSREALANFADYRALVANPAAGPRVSATRRRYLSKNNNNLLRLDVLCADPTATVLLAFREPVATATSLQRQHERFIAMQADDPFVRRYMDWLEHFEFGPGHLPFCFARPRMNPSLTPDQPDYWLNYWCAVYEHVADRRDARLFFVHHDELRADPAGQVAAVLDVLHAPADAAALATQIAPSGREGVDRSRYAPDLVARAEAVYQRLMDSPRTIRASGATARGTGAS